MKLVLVTAVEEFQKDVLKIFTKANIKNFSSADIAGYKNAPSLLMGSNWFSAGKSGNESIMFFSFTNKDKIDDLFKIIQEFNNHVETNNPIKAIVVPVEKFL
ncbi:MAG: hypothetical protein HOC83_04735 [Polaribacter sp.]|jgi:hypothetical protein|nr:hypothetical protein [Polaribacter sp.]